MFYAEVSSWALLVTSKLAQLSCLKKGRDCSASARPAASGRPTAGYAGGDIHAWDALAGGAGTSLLSGWTAGAGIEALIAQNWSVKFEYLHVDLEHAAVFDIVQGVSETVSFTGDIFRVGLNLRFNAPPAPTYARPMYTK